MKSVYVHLEKKQISKNRFCKLFYLHDDEKKHAYLMKLSNKTHSDFELLCKTVINNQSHTIHSDTTRPRRFSHGNIQTMSGITDSVGDTKNFNKRNNIVNGQEEVPMTTSKHFEHAYINLSTMTKNQIDNKERKWKFIHH